MGTQHNDLRKENKAVEGGWLGENLLSICRESVKMRGCRGKGEMGQQEESGWVLFHLSPPSDPEVQMVHEQPAASRSPIQGTALVPRTSSSDKYPATWTRLARFLQQALHSTTCCQITESICLTHSWCEISEIIQITADLRADISR